MDENRTIGKLIWLTLALATLVTGAVGSRVEMAGLAEAVQRLSGPEFATELQMDGSLGDVGRQVGLTVSAVRGLLIPDGSLLWNPFLPGLISWSPPSKRTLKLEKNRKKDL